MEKINIAELLKDYPSGMELYSPIFGDVYLDEIRPYLAVVVRTSDKQKKEFLYDGRFGINGECMLFPSKENRDWSTFQRPFKDGDILAYNNKSADSTIFIYRYDNPSWNTSYFVGLSGLQRKFYKDPTGALDAYNPNVRFATEEEKQKLFDAIKANGYKWNIETKTLERLIIPKFKVGDRIRHKVTNKDHIYEISKVYDDSYGLVGFTWMVYMKYQDDYELVPNKFDITTLKPFDKVLARQDNRVWECDFFSSYDSDERDFDKFHCVGGWYKECIPYKGNEHLRGKTDDCSDYFKTWE